MEVATSDVFDRTQVSCAKEHLQQGATMNRSSVIHVKDFGFLDVARESHKCSDLPFAFLPNCTFQPIN